MGFKQCPQRRGYYPASRGGCINSSCQMADRSAISRIVAAPVHPQTKAPIVPSAAPKVALRPTNKAQPPASKAKEPDKRPVDKGNARPFRPEVRGPHQFHADAGHDLAADRHDRGDRHPGRRRRGSGLPHQHPNELHLQVQGIEVEDLAQDAVGLIL